MEITERYDGFMVKFSYRQSLVDQIKQIPGRRYMGKETGWFIPRDAAPNLRAMATRNGFSMEQLQVVQEIPEPDPLPELDVDIPLKQEMFNFQTNGVAYSRLHKRVIAGDQPGLGKTVQSIATILSVNAFPCLVICPATLKENWKREWEMWTHKKALVLSDRVKKTWQQFWNVGMIDVFIVNYDSLAKFFVSEIRKPEDVPLRLNHIIFRENIQLFKSVIVDELHNCKDGRTKKAKFCMGITRDKEYILGLTGTPIVNKPKDLIAQLTVVQRLGDFGGYNGFVNTYCQGFNEASNLKQLNYTLRQTCFYQRYKKDVLKDLPDKLRSIVRCDITNRPEYDKAESNLVAYLRENMAKTEGEITTSLRGEAMVLIQILKKISARGKVEAMTEYIQEIRDAGEKVVVFAHHKDIIAELLKAFPHAVTVVGDDSMEKRQGAVDGFQQNPEIDTILCNIKSGGVGITLTAASRVGFIEFPWHPADCDQCEDRCHRIGQKSSVQATYFMGIDTIDEYLWQIIEKKRAIVNEATGAKDLIETNIVDEFINLFMKDRKIA